MTTYPRKHLAWLTCAAAFQLLFSVTDSNAQPLPAEPSAWPAALASDAPPTERWIQPHQARQDELWNPASTESSAVTPLTLPEIQPVNYETMETLADGFKPMDFEVGPITVTPYGILWTDMIYASSRTFPGQFILWVESEETHGEDSFVIDTRMSRVGANIKGTSVDVLGGLTGGGKIEVDFLGGFVTENQTSVRLRHVYWEAKNENWRFLTGQTWDVVSPLLPNTVNFSVSWALGNIGFRRAQFRAERYFHLSNGMTWTVQGALAQNIIPDLASGSAAEGVIRETPNWPMIQGRTALTLGHLGDCHQPVTVGISGHVGATGFDFTKESPGPASLPPVDDARFQDWSFNIDMKVPVSQRWGFHGEFFTGANLSNVLGGIVQGVCPCLRVPIRSTGGWGEVWYDLTPYVHLHGGYGIDDPNNADSLIGRTRNRVYYGNVFLDLTEHLKTGFEVASYRTDYHNLTLNEPDPADRIAGPSEPGESVALHWTVRYHF